MLGGYLRHHGRRRSSSSSSSSSTIWMSSLIKTSPSLSLAVLTKPSPLPLPGLVRYSTSNRLPNQQQQQQRKKKKRNLVCRAELFQDAPFALAIGGCVLNSLVFPSSSSVDEGEGGGDSTIDATDARFAVMGIISFIPYFNWLSWVFAWLDTNQKRYVVYSIVYLAPYIRMNLSLSPEESWLPLASIIICIIHIQLEASIRNGDLQGFQLFNEAFKSAKGHRRRGISNKGKKEHSELPFGKEQSRSEVQGWGVSKKSLNHRLEEDEDADGRGKT